MSDAEKRSITIPINLDDVKDPKDMTRDELMEYLSSIDDVEHKISLRLSDVSKRLSDVLISSSMMALDVLRERLDNLAQRIIDQDITADELVQLTEILKEAWIFQNAENADQYSLFTDEDQPQALSLQKDFIPILDGALSKDVMRISTKSAKMDNFTKTATIRQSSSSSITIERFDQMQGALSTSAKKILDTSLAFLGAMNYFRSSSKQPSLSVEIPLIEYGEANGYQLTPRTMGTQEEQEAEQRRVDERIRELKRSIKRDLTDLASITWTGTETKGKNKGDYSSMRIISSHSIRKGIITVNFDVEAARYFVNAYVMRWPTVLLKHDNRNPNAYVIGRKIAYHNGNDQNAAAGTNCTLSVSSLLAAAPEIQTIEELKARGQRNWKDKIKPVIIAPETMLAKKMMQNLLKEKKSMAIVVDEFGGTAGMITLEDLVEEIFGDIEDEHDRRKLIARKTGENTYELSGRLEIERVNELFDLNIPESDDYQTIAGFIVTNLEVIPNQGEEHTIGNYTIHINKKTGARLELITLTVNTPLEEQED